MLIKIRSDFIMANKESYKKYELINYFDVWGNPEDGYEVNNQCIEFNDLWVADDATNDDILKYLQSIGFLKSSVTLDQLTFDDCAMGYIELRQAADDCPICALREIEE
jgi:hypothetical protein